MEGAFTLSNEEVDPMDIVEKIKMMAIPRAEIKELNCNIIVKNQLPTKVYCDPRRLSQVIINLVFNSIKYTFSGGIHIEFAYNEDNSNLHIAVKDTGIGISTQELDKLNTIFGLIEKKCLYNQTGIGLGLTISKSILAAMQGTLNITSKPGIGTECKAKVPLTLVSVIYFIIFKVH